MRRAEERAAFSTGIRQTAGRMWQEIIAPRDVGYSGAGRAMAAGEKVDGLWPSNRTGLGALVATPSCSRYRRRRCRLPRTRHLECSLSCNAGGH